MIIMIIDQDSKLLQIKIEYHRKRKEEHLSVRHFFAIFVDTPFQMAAMKKAQLQKWAFEF